MPYFLRTALHPALTCFRPKDAPAVFHKLGLVQVRWGFVSIQDSEKVSLNSGHSGGWLLTCYRWVSQKD